ncbi:hypothetical protein FIV42_13730 [Persicimonas caeni]|uniref:Uncharacterized protein n=1 Tax=Persicimonas caeni TaxID=2292766 RepID=A0A4Y6PUI1_PERCE|nr:hypothetical protein [Persicimonas caeni]QDG51769.1 hypothetical protein FIV42_13730 [Persicimonas caeni]QED32990.1 hypothetical protein FRD00_13725 [Persicimonas caeni]
MEIIITQWALDSYLNLRHTNVFDGNEYWIKLRPDVMRLQHYPNDPKFQNGKFWSIASGRRGPVTDGFKMKWHNVGNGNVQLRLTVGLLQDDAYLCEAYVKDSPQIDRRMIARFSVHLTNIRRGRYVERGRLT